MALNKPVRRIAIVGTGVIGASWAAEFLAHGFDVVATDPAANAEQNLRRFVDAAWPALTAKGLAKTASRNRLSFSQDMRKAVSDKPGLPHVTFSDETHGDAVVYFPGEPVLHTGDLGVTPGAPFCGTAGG